MITKNTFGDRLTETSFAITIFDWDNAVYLVISVLVFLAARFLYPLPYWFILPEKGFFSPSSFKFNEKLITEDNKGVALSFGAFVISLANIMNIQIATGGDNKGKNIAYFAIWVSIGFALLLIARFVNVFLIVRSKDCIRSMTNESNIGVACVEAGSFIGSSFIIKASTAGDSSSEFWEDIVTTFLYFTMGHIGFVIFIFAYQKLISKINLQEQLMNKNHAVGVSIGLNLIAVGFLISIPITASDSVLGFWVWFLLGSIIIFILRFITNRIILWGEDLDKEMVEDQNWGAALIEGCLAIMLVAAMDTFLGLDPNNVINCDK